MDAMPQHRWFRYSLRTLLILVTVASAGFGWLGFKVRQKQRERTSVVELKKLGAFIRYRHEVQASPSPGPEWLLKLLGDDFFAIPDEVHFTRKLETDAQLVLIQSVFGRWAHPRR